MQLHRKRLLILCRSETTDWLEVRLEEVDVRTFRYKECTDVGIACIRIEIWERGSLLVCLGYSSVGNLYAEGIRIRTVYSKNHSTTKLLYAFIGISIKSKSTYYTTSVDIVTPLRVTARLIIETDSSILLIVSATTIIITSKDEGEVLVGIRSRWVDVQIEHGIPGLAIRNDIVLGEGCPPTCRIVSSTDCINILFTFWQCIVIALSGIDGVYLF